MHKPEFVIENERLKILWHFQIQADPLICRRKHDIVFITKNKEFTVSWILTFLHTRKMKIKDNAMRDKYLDPARQLGKETVKYEGEGDNNCFLVHAEPS